MKKKTTLRFIASFAIAMLFSFGANAQGIPNADYSVYDADVLAPTNVEYVTVGAILGYYADPDVVYHPNYAATSALTGGFTWAWTAPTDPGTAPTIDAAAGVANYATITYPVVGGYVINVAETAPVVFGGCVDASPTVMNVTAIARPTGTMSIAPAGWQTITANESYQICGDQLAETVTITFVENVPAAIGSYSFQLSETIEMLNGAGAVVGTNPQDEAVIENWPLTNKLNATSLDGDGDATTIPAAAYNTATANTFTFTFNTVALDIEQNATVDARTRYTYKVMRSGEALPATNVDFTSNIVHKSDYLATAFVSEDAFTVSEVSFIVNPTPSTGPIYHISNTWAN